MEEQRGHEQNRHDKRTQQSASASCRPQAPSLPKTRRILVMLVITVGLLNFGVGTHFVDHQRGVEGLNVKTDDKEVRLASAPVLARRLQPVVSLPTNNRPFAFFHNRKSGGTTLRSAIYNAARKNNLTDSNLWVPCSGSVPCEQFEHIPRVSYYAIYASHINYEELVRARRQMLPSLLVDNKEYNDNTTLSSGKNATYYHLNDDRHHFDCLTNIRQTVSRVVSCYNFRFHQDKKKSWDMPYADEMTPDDWKALLPQAYDKYAAGCNNELLRTFGSLNDETIINTFTKDSPYFKSELRRAAGRMARCIIVDLHRCDESNAVLRHYLPWLGHSLDLCTGHEQIGQTSSNHTRIREGSAEAILAHNEFDEALFRFGTKLFDEQLKIAQSVLRAGGAGVDLPVNATINTSARAQK